MADNATTDLAQRIRELLERRERHADAIKEIDQTLERVGSALGAAVGPGGGRRRGRPPKSARPDNGAAAAGAEGGRGAGRGGRRRRRTYASTGDESILTFVREHENPTTREIKEHWAMEGRRGTADNVLSKLVREKKLKREPIGVEGERGSRYVEA